MGGFPFGLKAELPDGGLPLWSIGSIADRPTRCSQSPRIGNDRRRSLPSTDQGPGQLYPADCGYGYKQT